MELMWHNMSDKFDCEWLEAEANGQFSRICVIISNLSSRVFGGSGKPERWIVQQEDLKVMYKSFNPEDDIKLWCESKVKEEGCGKRGNENKEEEPKSNWEKNEDVKSEICAQLEEKHGEKYSGPIHCLRQCIEHAIITCSIYARPCFNSHFNLSSPNNQANLHRKYLEDLRTLSQLFNDGVLSDTEFQEQDVLLIGL